MTPDSPVFPGDFSLQENLDISQPYLPLPLPSATPEPGGPTYAAPCPGGLSPLLPAGRQQGREKDKLGHTHTRLSNVQDLAEDQGELDAASSEGAFVFVFPAAVLKDKLEERVVALCYVGHGLGGLPHLRHPMLLLSFLVEPSPQAKPSLTEVVSSPQKPAPAPSFPCGSAGADHRHSSRSGVNALQPLAGFAQIAPVRSGVNKAWKPSCGQNTTKITGTLQCHWPQMAAPTHREDLAPSETGQQ